MLSRLMRLCLPGLGDTQYAECDAELKAYLARQARDGSGAPKALPGDFAY